MTMLRALGISKSEGARTRRQAPSGGTDDVPRGPGFTLISSERPFKTWEEK